MMSIGDSNIVFNTISCAAGRKLYDELIQCP